MPVKRRHSINSIGTLGGSNRVVDLEAAMGVIIHVDGTGSAGIEAGPSESGPWGALNVLTDAGAWVGVPVIPAGASYTLWPCPRFLRLIPAPSAVVWVEEIRGVD